MKLHWPESLDDAVALLSANPDARAHAGGATLVAMMNADLVAPSELVLLRRIAALRGIEKAGDGRITIGAMTTHAEVETADGFEGAQRVVRLAAHRIAHPPIRAVGTIGGAVAHADPAADYPAALVAADAEIVCLGPSGERRVPARDFFEDYFETALEPGELVRAVDLPPGPKGAVAVYDKLARVEGDYAIVSVAAVIAMDGAECSHARLAAGACGPTPVHVEAADAALVGSGLDDAAIAKAIELLGEAADPIDDVRASGNFRRKVMMRMMRRAIEAARDGEAEA